MKVKRFKSLTFKLTVWYIIILGVIVGASVAGVLGVALAAPTIASLRIIMRYVYANLFDLDPFPMIGAPSSPRQEREAEVERLTAAASDGASSERGEKAVM